MFNNYFDPISSELVAFKESLSSSTIGFHVNCYSGDNFPDIENADIAVIIVPENRGGKSEFPIESYDNFRKSFYSLFRGGWKCRIMDFGNLKSGSSIKDTYFALNDIISSLLSQSVFPIVLGGTHDLTYPMYQSYQSFTKGVNLLCVDSRFDLLDIDMLNINARNFLGYIIKEEPNHLSHFMNIGYQSYLCQNDESHLLEKMLFETCRLGDIREDTTEAEPYLRNSDIVTVDMSAIKHADAPGTTFPSPNGLESHHACVISRYAGMSDRVSSFGIFEFNPHKDVSHQTVNLISQIIWYFLEGFNLRVKDYPNANNINNNYQKYIVPIKDSDLQFAFYKSKKTGRWWLSSSIELDENANYNEKIIPCSYQDYVSASSGNLPKRVYRILKSLAS